jgi:hypothetical protein
MGETEYWGIDSEASATGLERSTKDVHTVQVCSSRNENTGRVFYSPADFKHWYRNNHSYPKLFYAFTLAFEFGSLAAWELLNAQDAFGGKSWQDWADEPLNLFHIKIDKTKISVFDVRVFFHQLRHGNNYLTNLEKLGNYLSDYYGVDAKKLPPPLGVDFGKRAPTEAEKPYFEQYGIRDAYICALAAKWIHENVVDGWLKDVRLGKKKKKVAITQLYSWGTVARHYFGLPDINEIQYYGNNKGSIKFPNQWHSKIFDASFAGRSEAFVTGNVGQVYYCDVSSLYPVSLIQTQAFLIRDVKEFVGDKLRLLGKASWQNFYAVTGTAYGWILGDFRTESDLWGLPIKQADNNWFVTGILRNRLYHVLDLEASNAEILRVDAVLVPKFDTNQPSVDRMRKYEELTDKKLGHKCGTNKIEEHCIKMTTNSAYGVLGKSHPDFATYTNLPAYGTILAQSHLFMSELFHKFSPIVYTDTDSFFVNKPVKGTIRECEPYPTLPFQRLATVPLIVDVKAQSKPTGAIVFRGKMYSGLVFEGVDINAFSAWHPHPKYFAEILEIRPTEPFTVEQQASRKWRTRDKSVTALRVGGWFVEKVEWNLAKLKEIFRADTKRKRDNPDSYQLFLDGKSATSRSWTVDEALRLLETTPWQLEIGKLTTAAYLKSADWVSGLFCGEFDQ